MMSLNFDDLSLIISTQQEVATSSLKPDALMTLVCERTQLLTKAAGAVVEIPDGDEMVYRAAAGTALSSLNFRLKIQNSLSGLSLSTREILECKDSETDPRVNLEACRKVNVRSMVVVPLITESRALGILKVMSPVPNAFTGRELKILQLMAGLLSASLAQAHLVVNLSASENRFRALVDASYGAVVIAEKGFVVEANAAFCEMFGYTPEEIVGIPSLNLVTPEAVEVTKKHIEINYEKPYEIIAVRKDGSTFAIEAVGKTTQIDGRAVRVTAARDISQRKMDEEKLRASEMKFRSVLHSVNDSIVAANRNGDIIAWNRAAETIFGYTEAEALGRPLTMLMPERYRAAHSAGMNRVVRTGQTKLVGKTVELVGLKKDESEFPIELSLATWEQDSETYFTSVIRDLTSKRQAENTLKETSNMLQTLVSSSPVGIVLLDMNLNLIIWNPTCEKIFGWTAEEVMGKPLPFVPENKQAVPNFIANTMKETRSKYTTQVKPYRKDGQQIDVHISGMPLINDKGEVFAHMGVITDVTDEVIAADLLRTARENAELATKAKSEFLANMSHEIRTPLNGIVGMTNLLLDTELRVEQRDYAEAVRSSAETLLTIINDILDFSKVEAGKMQLEVIDFEIDQVVHDIEKSLGFAASKKGLSLFKSRSPNLPEHFRGDPTRLRQVMLNLVSNALKFTPKGHVRIEIRDTVHASKGSQVLFEVTDTGIGIPPEALDRMFQAFSQADSSTTRRFGGTGLGLSICKHLVNLMGGEIGVRSEVGVGSTFWFTLPLQAGKAPVSEKVVDSVATKPLKRLRILIAEDISVNQIIAIKMFERLGHSAMAVANGQEVLDSIRETPFDVIFMDCQMPEMDGYAATRHIRESKTLSCTNIPIIAMTANAMEGDREKCLEAGMDDYITKPVKARDLENVLSRTMAAKKAAA